MQPDRIAELLVPFLGGEQLTAADLNGISTYIDILLRWNSRINLTAIREPDQIVTRHFGESLFAASHLFPKHAAIDPALHATSPGTSNAKVAESPRATAAERRQNAAHGASRGLDQAPDQAAEQRKRLTLADIGSGAGFPGIPIRLWAPEIAVTLVESNHKKSTFLREIARALILTDINIQNVRAESLPRASFDVVTLRAVERFDEILPTAATLVAPAGRLALLIGSAQLPAARSLLPAHILSTPVPIPGSATRILVTAKVQ